MITKKFRNKFSSYFKELLKTKTSPHSIAMGFSIGTFVAILPTPGLNILLGLLIVFIFKKISKFALFGAMAIFNPLVLTPIYVFSYKIGNVIFSSEPIVRYKFILLFQIYEFSRRFLVGNLFIATSISILSYFIVKKIVKKYEGLE